MPTWRDLSAFQADLERMSRDLEREQSRSIRRDMAEKAQQIAERAASHDLGGDPKFSGWAPRLDTQIKENRDATFLLPTRTSAGPWTVAQFGRHADGGVGRFQGPGVNMRTGRTSRRRDGSISVGRRRTGVRWNGVTRGKGTADKAFAAMERELPRIAERGVKRAIARRFDVS